MNVHYKDCDQYELLPLDRIELCDSDCVWRRVDEQAAEIERLRGLVVAAHNPHWHQAAEIERLRGLVKQAHVPRLQGKLDYWLVECDHRCSWSKALPDLLDLDEARKQGSVAHAAHVAAILNGGAQ